MSIRSFAASMILVVAVGVNAAPPAKALEGRGRAIDLLAQGQTLEAQGDVEGAIRVYAQSIQAAPSPAAYYQLGLAYGRSGDKESARKYLNEALKLNPGYELAKLELINLDKGRTTQVARDTDLPVPGAMGMEAGDSAINVDTLQRENLTLRSLQRPATLVGSSDQSYEPGPKTPGRFFGFVPAAPQVAGAGDPPRIPPAAAVPTQPGTGRRAMEPMYPTVIENEVDLKVISPHEGDPGEENSEREIVRAAATPAPGDFADRGTHPGRIESADPSLRDSDLEQDVGRTGEARMPTASEINQAAFGSVTNQAQKPSVVYGQTSKVALGTYAFHKEKGDSYRASKRWMDAAGEYEIALRLAPRDPEVRSLLADVLAQAGETEQAQRQFDKAEATAPDDPRVYYRRGNMYRDQQKPDLAIGAYRQAIALDSSNKFAHNNLGVVYMEQGQYTKAVSSFKKVLELDPNYEKAILNLGIIYDDNLGNKDLALKYYDDYLRLGGDRAAEVQRWAEAIRKTQQPESAKPQ